ncbi:MAG: thymidine phosphorylase family protein [Betaproteobacteria bacterium]
MTGQPVPAVPGSNQLRARWLGIDTYKQPVIYMHRDCLICRSEGFAAQARVRVELNGREIIATLNVVDSGLVDVDEAGLSKWAWHALGAADGDLLDISHAPELESLRGVRAKLFGETLSQQDLNAIIQDIARGHYADIHLAAFVAAVAAGDMSVTEVVSLTRAMVDAGSRLQWPHAANAPIADKHCIGGLPGNRTSLIIVPIIAAAGLVMPKTSSRAITSPAGTADTMEVLAPVTHDLVSMRRIVEREGGCIVWGGAVSLSPADDALISVERPLDLDGPAQLVASVISKKVAAGSTHAIVDIPVGPTAKVRSHVAARKLGNLLEQVGAELGLAVQPIYTDGLQPIGRGIGPALEARDVLAVLRRAEGAPLDLRERALELAGALLEFCKAAPEGKGFGVAEKILDSGQAYAKFLAICDAQGGFNEPPRASFTHVVLASRAGRIVEIGNRRLARIAKLAGAPRAPAAGIDLHVACWARVEKDSPLFTLHAQSPGELQYALDALAISPEIFRMEHE